MEVVKSVEKYKIIQDYLLESVPQFSLAFSQNNIITSC